LEQIPAEYDGPFSEDIVAFRADLLDMITDAETREEQAKAEREPGDNDTPRRDRKQVETDQGRIARHEGSIRSVGSFQIALTP